MKPAFLAVLAALASRAAVTPIRTPNSGIQPQAVERDGVLHLIYHH
ncbi:MAG TPA: hypothetical protein VKB79_14545 [Bryobacteraceae bacterium]|nr:hypothetical protein [Bryobacteraceae bacterium]